ncbi:hypothetical protein J2X36_002176 [Methylobacterium sp. BE186]|uniref:hypothetical protein n=1 Tax=Methylobacterium sp. BE186 TaxID=2817715 RepID=UPI00285C3A6C|nr:hypothetical protein [Methylobacterium sp. BE186]MDR7037429.1 hypothetical protein [Methylobacterium sp. BE186]
MTRPADPTLTALYENALRDIAEILADATEEVALAALQIAADALTHALDEMEARG